MNKLTEDEDHDSCQEFASQALRLTRKGSFEQLLAQHLIQSISMVTLYEVQSTYTVICSQM